jgi:hypothetical protein
MKGSGKILLAAICAASLAGNAEAQKSKDYTLGGVAIGAITGGLITGKGGGAAVGALAGGSLGYVIGSDKDKQRAQQQAAQEQAARDKAQVGSDPATAYQAPEENPFVGSTWQVVSLVTEKPRAEYASIIVNFSTNSKVTTISVLKNGDAETKVESYRIVDDAMIITGTDSESGEPYMINAKFDLEDGRLILVAPEGRAVLKEIEDEV